VYNYRKFTAAETEVSQDTRARVGLQMPDFAAGRLDGGRAQFSDFLGRPVMLETGSITCPIYCRHIDGMNRLAGEFPEVSFLVLYVREAHPGARIPAHRSYAEKLQHARALAQQHGERRTVLVDDLEGTAHRALGGLPDMLYLTDAAGIIVYRAKWATLAAAGAALLQFRAGQLLDGIPSPYRIGPPWRVVHALRRAGPDAIAHFLRAYPRLVCRQWRARLAQMRHAGGRAARRARSPR
jgi:hypothetical protein